MLTAEKIYAAVAKREAANRTTRRWLGASMVGHECDRCLACTFRAAYEVTHPGRVLRLFRLGQDAEARFLADLEAAGVRVLAYQAQVPCPGTLGHAGATTDGIVEVDGYSEPLVLELKTHSDKSFAQLKSKGVRESKPMHWAQCQFGMLCAELPNALYVAENKDNSELYLEFVSADRSAQVKLHKTAVDVTSKSDEPARIADRADDFRCKFCNFAAGCWSGALPEVRCTTCCFGTPATEGRWHCERANDLVPEEVIMCGCDDHVFLPWLVPAAVTGADPSSVRYRTRSGVEFANTGTTAFPAITEGDAPLIFSSRMLRRFGNISEISQVRHDAFRRSDIAEERANA